MEIQVNQTRVIVSTTARLKVTATKVVLLACRTEQGMPKGLGQLSWRTT
jgi:hypothetical protein